MARASSVPGSVSMMTRRGVVADMALSIMADEDATGTMTAVH